MELSSEGSLEDRLKALEPNGAWKARFCNGGGGGGGSKGAGKGGQEGEKGAPALLLVSPAAMGAIKLMKHCPDFHKVMGWLAGWAPVPHGLAGRWVLSAIVKHLVVVP